MCEETNRGRAEVEPQLLHFSRTSKWATVRRNARALSPAVSAETYYPNVVLVSSPRTVVAAHAAAAHAAAAHTAAAAAAANFRRRNTKVPPPHKRITLPAPQLASRREAESGAFADCVDVSALIPLQINETDTARR